MKKKLALLLLAVSMGLSACGAETLTDAETSVEVEAEAETEVEEVEVEKVVVEEEATAEETEAEETTGYVKGSLTETGWESEWIGIRYTCPEAMFMFTEAQLNEAMGLGQEMLSEDFTETQLDYASLVSVYEMMCSDETGANNIAISVEKLVMKVTTEQYVEALESQLAAVSTIAYEVVNSGEVVAIGGVDFTKVECVATYEGVVMHQDYYVTIKEDRAVTAVVTYMDGTGVTVDTMMSGFAAY